MHPRIREVIGYLDHCRKALIEAIDDVPMSRWAERVASNRWSVEEVLEHLVIVEGRLSHVFTTRVAAQRERGLGAEADTGSILESFDGDRLIERSNRFLASEASTPRGGIPSATLRYELECTRETTRRALLEADGLALGEVSLPHPVLGSVNLYHWMLFIGAHEARHAAQIREIQVALAAR